MFNSRFGGQGGSSPTQPPSIETVRRRARHRLLGASFLVLAGVIGFPLLFESQPRPQPSNFEIEIPARKTAQPLGDTAPAAGVRIAGLDEKEELLPATPASPPMPAPAAAAVPAPAVAPAPVAAVATPAAPAPPEAASPLQAPKPWERKPVPEQPAADKTVPEKKPAEPRPADKPAESKPAGRSPDDSVRARALLEGRSPSPDKPADDKPDSARHVVQVGAFVDPALAEEARLKLERAGLRSYTQISKTPDGPRTRVRLGPFSTRADADKAAAKARSLGLSVAILAL